MRLTLNTEEDRPTIHSPADAAAMLQHEMSALEQEHLRVILLDLREAWESTIKEERKDLVHILSQEVGVDVTIKRVLW